jgi:hypothetical protein
VFDSVGAEGCQLSSLKEKIMAVFASIHYAFERIFADEEQRIAYFSVIAENKFFRAAQTDDSQVPCSAVFLLRAMTSLRRILNRMGSLGGDDDDAKIKSALQYNQRTRPTEEVLGAAFERVETFLNEYERDAKLIQ